MASFETVAFISQIKYLQTCILVYLDEFHKGYKNKDGTVVDDKYVTIKTIWKPYFTKYINEHFNHGMLVQVKGEMLPYAIEHDTIVEGYTVIGQCINRFSYPRLGVKEERRMIKESMEHASIVPDLQGHNEPDF